MCHRYKLYINFINFLRFSTRTFHILKDVTRLKRNNLRRTFTVQKTLKEIWSRNFYLSLCFCNIQFLRSNACIFLCSISPFYNLLLFGWSLEPNFFFVVVNVTKRDVCKRRKSTETISCHKLFLYLSRSLSPFLSLTRRNMKFHSNLLNFLRFFFSYFFRFQIDFLFAAKLNLYRNCIFFSILSFICSSFAKCCR